MPVITTIREYNPVTGAFIGNVSVITCGRMAAGMHSRVKLYDAAFTGSESVTNIKLGIVNSGGIIVNPGALDIAADGSSSNGNFGIMHSLSFDPVIGAGPLIRHFAGLNSSGTANDANNVVIGNRDAATSQFFYIDISPGSNNIGSGAPIWKIFCDAS